MGLFKNKEGGLMDVIRCDEKEYLVWKWRPSGDANSTRKENAIRYGSSLRVKDGEVAVFVYRQKDGTMHDYIVGPYDETIKTANFPILTSIVGTAFGGESPFQAEIYFINLAENVQIRFAVPYFDVFDPRFLDFAVPFAVRGILTFNITDYKSFIKLNRLINFTLDDFKGQIKDSIIKYVKGVVANVPSDYNIPVIQMEKKVLQINDMVSGYLKPRLEGVFGVNLKAIDISAIEPDKESEGYQALMKVTKEQTSKTTIAQTDVNIKNLQDTQRIASENMEETMRIQREEMQRAQRLQTETNHMGAHALDQQVEVLKTAAESLGQMGAMSLGGEAGSLSPAGMMTGMMMGGAVGQQMAGMMGQMGQTVSQSMNTPPPPPQSTYFVSTNGQTTGPFTIPQLQQMVNTNDFTCETYVWKAGMKNWEKAGAIAELATMVGSVPPTPPMPEK